MVKTEFYSASPTIEIPAGPLVAPFRVRTSKTSDHRRCYLKTIAMKKIKQFLAAAMGVLLMTGCGGSSSDAPAATTETAGWIWVGGSKYSDVAGYVFTAQGGGSTLNMPGARSTSVSWIDQSGHFWLFGGLTRNALTFLGDLWRYDPVTGEWAWMKGALAPNTLGRYGEQGVAAAGNAPGARIGPVAWTDTQGNLWMYGGFGYGESGDLRSIGTLNDLWKYNIETGWWTWVSGSKVVNQLPSYVTADSPDDSNTPGGLVGANGWITRDGHLWIFGGAADAALTETYNNLWEFDPVKTAWIFRGGAGKDESSTYIKNAAGVYGTRTVSAASNQPGSRLDAVSWLDSSENLWFFGGHGWDSEGTSANILNDLWKYDTSAREWTWMNGSKLSNAFGVYGTQGVAGGENTPGARWYRGPFAWVDTSGSFWMFGADGNGATQNGLLNDWWKYDARTNQWTWMSGSTEPNALPDYGSLNIYSENNQPGARKDVIGWSDRTGNLWLFGGYGPDSTGNAGYLNDLWKYAQQPDGR